MHVNLLKELKRTRHLLPNNLGNVLDVGSLDVNGNPKEMLGEFNQYVGIDMRGGRNVDLVMNAHDLKDNFMANSFDTVVCMNTLEHDDAFWLTIDGINHILKSGGFQIFAVPTFFFPEHNYPDDYWRMGESAVRNIVFKGYEVLHLRKVYINIGHRIKCDECQQGIYNHVIFAVGRKL